MSQRSANIHRATAPAAKPTKAKPSKKATGQKTKK